jgi:hypothetical protein
MKRRKRKKGLNIYKSFVISWEINITQTRLYKCQGIPQNLAPDLRGW